MENIIEKSSIKMYEEDQCKYAIVVDRRRAIPEIKDGLKPIQRRILFGAFKDHLLTPKDKDKTVSLAGTVMKRYHPHGEGIDLSISTLIAWYKIKYPIMYGKGNWGSVSGSGPAAPRYTECALNEFGYDIYIDEIAQSPNIVNWLDTYKRNGEKEPEYLPAKIPMLLINGTFGIGVGLQVSIPSHNLVEVIEATKTLLKNPNADVVLIPDLCQGCDLVDTNWKSICDTGRGSFKVRGRITEETDKKGNVTLHIISLPDTISTKSVYESILDLIEKKQLPMVKDIFDSLSDDGRPDIIIKLKQGADINFVKQFIYDKTEVEHTVSVNFEAVAENGIDIKRYSYKEYLLSFIKQRMAMKFRLYCNKLQQAATRFHQIDAFVKVLESGEIDNIINMIKKSKKNDDDIMEYIIKKCNITDIQARFILSCNIGRLSYAHLAKYKEERVALKKEIDSCTPIVTGDSKLIRAEIENELNALENKYGDKRLCRVISKAEGAGIPNGSFKIVITEKNFIRKIPDGEKIGIVRHDNPKIILKVDNAENILIFDNKGKVFKLPVSKIPITDKTGAGTDIRILVRNLTADIITVYYEPIFNQIIKSGVKHYLIVLMKSNVIKKLDIEDFLNVNPSGLMYSKVKDNDEVVGVSLAPHNLDVVICSGKKALRYPIKEIPLLKRNAVGNKAFGSSDPINGMSIIYPDVSDIVVLTKSGKFNRISITSMDQKKRGQAGNNVIKLNPGDEIFNIFGVNENDVIRVVSSDIVEEVLVKDIKSSSTISKGIPMLKSKGIIIRADALKGVAK